MPRKRKQKQPTEDVTYLKQNAATIKFFRIMSIASTICYGILSSIYCPEDADDNTIWVVIKYVLPVGLHFWSHRLLQKLNLLHRDINKEGGFGNYIKEFLICLSMGQVLSVVSGYFWFLAALTPLKLLNHLANFIEMPWLLLKKPKCSKRVQLRAVGDSCRCTSLIDYGTMWNICVPGWGAVMVAGALLLYGTLDVAYFARMMYTVARARYFKKKACILETTEVHCWCLLNDIDTLLYHMNNARYLRELDFARADFYERTGLYNNIKAAGGAVVQAAATIRYRRYLKPFTKFTITSKAIYWDDKTVFMEHEFVGPGGFVHAVAVCRQRVIDTSAAAIADLLLQLHCAGACRPAPAKMPQELELWVQSNELSSAKLRAPNAPLPSLPPALNINIGSGEIVPAPSTE